MLFEYNEFIKELRSRDEKKEIVEDYSRYYGPQDHVSISETPFYKDYLSKFELPFKLVVPEDLEDDFDWDLLAKLVFGSFSSDYELYFEENKQTTSEEGRRVRLHISAEKQGEYVVKELSELWSFQILRLYEIYIEEQMKLFSLLKEDEEEGESVYDKQSLLLHQFRHKINILMGKTDYDKELEEFL